MSFNIELFNTWISTLKSKQYKQGKLWLTNKINNEDYYCCLGLLCKINDESDLLRATYLLPDKEVYYFLKTSILSDWLSDYEYTDEPGDLMMEIFLSKLNDYYNYSFEQIAFWLENHLTNYLNRYDKVKLRQLK